MKDFKQVYKFPLKQDHDDSSMVRTQDGHRAFDFLHLYEPLWAEILKWINGEPRNESGTGRGPLRLTRNQGGEILQNGKVLIRIRGWGHLTGTGGLNLPEDEAAGIQDAFANYIIKILS